MKEDASVADIYRARPHIYRHWIRMGEEVMTKDSPLSQGVRELIATYVSSLNNCHYCRTAHLPSMALHGIDQNTVDALIADIGDAPVEPRLKPIFSFVRKLTLTPSELTQADADTVYSAGWDEEALHVAVLVACRFNFMNRLVMAHGLKPPEPNAAHANAEQRLQHGYAGVHGDLARKTD